MSRESSAGKGYAEELWRRNERRVRENDHLKDEHDKDNWSYQTKRKNSGHKQLSIVKFLNIQRNHKAKYTQ